MDRWLTQRQVAERVIALVERVGRERALPPGATPQDVCACLGLSIHRGALPSGTDGLLVGRQIVINERVSWPPRVAFTIFHEVVHHLLDEDGEIIEFFTEALRGDERAYALAIERCCNVGAGEFLLPRERVRELLCVEGTSVQLVAQMTRDFGASLVATALQLALCAPQECYMVLATHGAIPQARPPRTGLYLEYAFASWSVRYPLARYTPVPDDHLLAAAWRDQQPAGGPSYIPFRSGRRMPCYAEVGWVGGRMIGLLTRQRPTSPDQLALPL